MLNQVVLVGRLVRDVEVKSNDNNKKFSFITLAIPRSFKNHDGIYETDFVECILWNNVASNTASYCKKGDIIGIKGRIESRILEKENNKSILQVIAEKVTFYLQNLHKNKKLQLVNFKQLHHTNLYNELVNTK